jgi:hypothetical protein
MTCRAVRGQTKKGAELKPFQLVSSKITSIKEREMMGEKK